MAQVLRAAFVYLGVVFAVAFVLGVLRQTMLAPRIGPFRAVAIEVPVILAVSWVVAGRVLARFPLGPIPAHLAMGGVAFALLMLLEAGLAVLAFGQTPADFLGGMATPAGVLGFAGQVGFALIPAVRQIVSTRRQ